MYTKNRTSTRGAVVQMAGAGMTASNQYVYAIGQIQWYFPSLDIAKEYMQLLPNPIPQHLATESQRVQYVLQKNPFLAREMGWTFLINEQSAYYLIPRSDDELKAFIEGMVPSDSTATRYDAIIGIQEPVPMTQFDVEMPAVSVTWSFSFTTHQLATRVTEALRKLGHTTLPQTDSIVDMFNSALQLADNTGDEDKHRALNYASVNYPDIYVAQWSQSTTPTNVIFKGIDAERSVNRAGNRTVINIILSYENTATSMVSRYFTGIDVTGQFPFVASKLQAYFER